MSSDLSSLFGNRVDPIQAKRKPETDPWQIAVIPALVGGLNSTVPTGLLNDNQSPRMENVTLRGNRPRVDTGYVAFADALLGVPKGEFEHTTADGTVTVLVVTDATVYKYNSTEDDWQVIKGDTSSDLDGAVSGGATSITVTSDTDFTVGAVIGIVLDSGKQHITTIDALPGANVIDLTDAVPGSGVVAADANLVLEGQELSGDDDHQVVFVPVPSDEWTVIINGVNLPMKYDATLDTVVAVTNVTDVLTGGSDTVRTGVVFKEALIFGNIVEAGVEKPYKYFWADPGNPDNWTTGNSGNNPLLDGREDIIAMKPIGPSCAIYRNGSIVRLDFRGAVGALFNANTTVWGTDKGSQPVGAVSPNSVFILPDEHLVFSSDGFYLYRGGYSTQLISGPVFEHVFGTEGDLDTGNIHRSFVFFMDRHNEVWFFYKSTDGTLFCDRAVILDLEHRTWRFRRFSADEITSAGVHSNVVPGVAIDDLVGTIDEQMFLLSGASASGSVPTIFLGLVTAKAVVDYNYLSPDDNGTELDWFIDTKDIDGIDRSLLHDRVEVYMGASTLGEVKYSTDMGATYISLGSITGDTNVVPRRFHKQFTARKWRYRISGSGGGAEIGKISFKFKEASISGS